MNNQYLYTKSSNYSSLYHHTREISHGTDGSKLDSMYFQDNSPISPEKGGKMAKNDKIEK